MNTPPFRILQENATELFDRILRKHSSRMDCQKGCSRCCETRFSVFAGEAELIREFVGGLPPEERNRLFEVWGQNIHKNNKNCSFLSGGRCTIYEARPIICRTQGAPLCLENERARTKTVTACELNFTDAAGLPRDPSDWFQLNRLTELQSIAEREFRKNGGPSAAIASIEDSEGRIELTALAEFLRSSARLPG